MSNDLKTKHPLRCFCSRQPLLAYYGIDKNHKLSVHVKVYKQNRIYGEMFVTGGRVKVRCRECLRWNELIIRNDTVDLEQSEDPEAIE